MDGESKNVAVLEVVDGPTAVKGRRVDYKGLPMVIGRSPRADLSIPDPKISKNHALLESRGHHYYLVDLDSKNGTFLNGERIMSPEGLKLRHGDDILVAESRLKFYLFENLGDAELQAIQKRITFNVMQKYSTRSAVLYCEIVDFRDLYIKYEVAEVDAIRDKFVAMYRELVHEGGPYYAEPRGENALAYFETSLGALEFSRTLNRRVDRLNLNLLRDPKAALKKMDIRIGIDAGPLSLVLGDEGRIEKISGSPMTRATEVCLDAGAGEVFLSEEAYRDIPLNQKMNLEETGKHETLGTLYRFLSDTTAYF